MTTRDPVEELLERYVERHVVHGERLDPEDLCAKRPELIQPLREYIRRYESLQETLDTPVSERTSGTLEPDEPLPTFEGFRTIERLGGGGGGQVYKLEDLELGRTVAAKVVRSDSPLNATLDDFVREARSLALFEDPRIVRIFEFRRRATPPVLLMEYVEGFELNRIGGSLEYSQRARVMIEICEAIDRAHALGIQHRDLKPANVLLDTRLAPKILDFGLSSGDPDRGHGTGTLSYMAPEQFDSRRPIDNRTDVYALGVLLYELLCGARPYRGATQRELLAAIEAGRPALPVEVEPEVPEALQAIALKAMEVDPARRYGSARELAQDLRRYLDDKPVLARPTIYQSALGRRLQPHMEQIREWLRLKLIYPHEAQRLTEAYRKLEIREVDWIIQSRSLSFSQISLYLGAFLLLCGSLLYFVVYLHEAVEGLWKPTLVLGLPFLGLNAAATRLFRRERQTVAVAFYLAAVVLLPLFLLIFFRETGLWNIDVESESELLGMLGEPAPSNRQLQLASLAGCAWSFFLAFRTRTVTLSACFTALAVVLNLSVLADFGLRGWFEEGRYDLLSLHLLPLLAVTVMLGFVTERNERRWFARPLYLTGMGLYVVALELLALDGKAFHYLGISAAPLAGEGDPLLLDTLAAMTIIGVLIYAAGLLLDRYGTELMQTPSWLLYSLSPFAILEPIAFLNNVGEYSIRYGWFYLILGLVITFLSHIRQRKSFYYAGLINTGFAIFYITNLYEWWDRPSWAVAVVLIGLAVLASGFALHVQERNRGRVHDG